MKKSVGTWPGGGGWPMSMKCWMASGRVPKNMDPPLWLAPHTHKAMECCLSVVFWAIDNQATHFN